MGPDTNPAWSHAYERDAKQKEDSVSGTRSLQPPRPAQVAGVGVNEGNKWLALIRAAVATNRRETGGQNN